MGSFLPRAVLACLSVLRLRCSHSPLTRISHSVLKHSAGTASARFRVEGFRERGSHGIPGTMSLWLSVLSPRPYRNSDGALWARCDRCALTDRFPKICLQGPPFTGQRNQGANALSPCRTELKFGRFLQAALSLESFETIDHRHRMHSLCSFGEVLTSWFIA